MPTTSNSFILQFDNNVVEHLGLKLYQNQPTRVIAEVISNSWDAGAQEVHVNAQMKGAEEPDPNAVEELPGPESTEEDTRWVAVIDNGYGMSRDDLSSAFLIIGRNKRSSSDMTKSSRKPMGRKGIGKLAPFGISRMVDVVTAGRPVSDDDSPREGIEITWLRLNLDEVLRHGVKGAYRCEVIYAGTELTELPLNTEDTTGQVREWADLIARSAGDMTGTVVIMRNLSLRKAISESQLIESLGRRFTVTFRDEFQVLVNGRTVKPAEALPAFDFRIPDGDEVITARLPSGHEVRYWVGFVKSASWPQDEAGVGVYAHGKIAQDRPFTFRAKGNEIYTRYMYAVVEADWLDDLPEDLISTDRTSINWDSEGAKTLFEWGRQKVGEWSRAFEKWRQGDAKEEARQILQTHSVAHPPRPTQPGTQQTHGIPGPGSTTTPPLPQVSDKEREEIIDLVSQITPRLGKDDEAKVNLVRVVSEAWVQKPMQDVLVDLWTTLGKTNRIPAESFADVVTKLTAYGIPESLNLAMVFAQRVFALTKLHESVHVGIENDLQRLIEKFPWIIEPDLAVLTANQQLKTIVIEAEKKGLSPFMRTPTAAGESERNRPDFVFLSSPEDRSMLVVELKNPQDDLITMNRKQLEGYLDYLREHYPDAEIQGVLVGRNAAKIQVKNPRNDIRVVEWTDVLARSRSRNVELLAAMLIRSGGRSSADVRIEGALSLGGPELARVLNSIAEHNEDLRALMAEFAQSRPDGTSGSEEKSS